MSKVIYAAAPGTSVGAGSEETLGDGLDVRCVEEIVIGLKVTYNASATGNALVKVMPVFSDGMNSLTVNRSFVEFRVPLDTSAAVIWMSAPIDVMALSTVDIVVENEDSSYSLTVDSIAVLGGL